MKQKIICGRATCRHRNDTGECRLKTIALDDEGKCILFQSCHGAHSVRI